MGLHALPGVISATAIARRSRTILPGDSSASLARVVSFSRSHSMPPALIETAKLNDIDPRAWLADVLARLPDHPAKRIGELLPWNWKPDRVMLAA
jgi:transposase